jgi:hypothetical protein
MSPSTGNQRVLPYYVITHLRVPATILLLDFRGARVLTDTDTRVFLLDLRPPQTREMIPERQCGSRNKGCSGREGYHHSEKNENDGWHPHSRPQCYNDKTDFVCGCIELEDCRRSLDDEPCQNLIKLISKLAFPTDLAQWTCRLSHKLRALQLIIRANHTEF